MNEWLEDLADVTAAHRPAVLVTIAGVRGSAPREAGAKMIVTEDECIGTIGGGQLEYESTRLAAGLLGGDAPPTTRRFPLGAAMGQCCGGVVDVLFEPLGTAMPGWLAELSALYGQRVPAALVTHIGGSAAKTIVTADDVRGAEVAADVVAAARQMLVERGAAVRIGDDFIEPLVDSGFDIAVFGAGHVGVAVVDVLSRLDASIRWIDSRRRIFSSVPRNARAIEAREPTLEVAAMPPGSFYLVMTHSHALDFEICARILERRDAAYCGLIGSQTKRRRFEKRFREQGLSADTIAGLVCPIGVAGIGGKKPAEIAVATAAELLAVRARRQRADSSDLPDNVEPIRK